MSSDVVDNAILDTRPPDLAAAAATIAAAPWALSGRTRPPMAHCLVAGAAAGALAAAGVRAAVRLTREHIEGAATRRAEEARERAQEDMRQFLHGALQTMEALRAPDSHTRLDLLRLQADREARSLRAYLNGSSPPADSLEPVIEQLVEEANGWGLDITVVREHGPDTACPMEPRVLDALRLAASEAFTNAVKHAGVESATLRYEASAASLNLSIADCGPGFDPDDPAHQRGFGLRRTIAGISRVGGSATVDSTPGGGTLVHLRVPLARGRVRAARRGGTRAGQENQPW